MTGSTTLWIIAGIFSCLIFTFNKRRRIKGMELVDTMMLLIIYARLVIMGPIGLTLLLSAQLIVFLSQIYD